MILLIDIGNTRLKWLSLALDSDIHTVINAQPHTLSHDQIEQLPAQWQALPITRVVIVCVAKPALRDEVSAYARQCFTDARIEHFESQQTCAGLINRYANPTQLGADRFASSLAARALFPGRAILVATCGTATTVDTINEQGEFLGGMILPGLQLMAKSLSQNTAQLPSVLESLNLTHAFADNTLEAIVSGCVHAQWGALDMAARTYEKQCGSSPVLLLSGGAASYLLPHLPTLQDNSPLTTLVWHARWNLVLAGLLVYAQNT